MGCFCVDVRIMQTVFYLLENKKREKYYCPVKVD